MAIIQQETLSFSQGPLFDTHAAVKEMVAAGFSERQAETQVRILADIIISNLATRSDLTKVDSDLKRAIEELRIELKRDIAELRVELKRDIEELRVELKRDMKELESRLIRDMKELESRLIIKLGGMMVVTVGVVATLAKLL